MMSITYGLIEEKYNCGGENRTSYGIAVYSNAEVDGSSTVIESVHDVTCDKERISRLIRDCNELHLSHVHLLDVVEDFLT